MINQRYLKLKSTNRNRGDRIIVERDFKMDEEVELVIRGQIVERKELSTDSEDIDMEYTVKGEIVLGEV